MAGEPGAPRPQPQAPGRRAGESKRARLREGPELARLGPPRPPEKMEAAPGPGQGRRKPGRRPRRELGRAGGHSRGWAERLPLRLRVVAVPVLGRRRVGLLAGSPRRGSGARPLRCLPPASTPGDGLPRRRRRLRGRTAAQRLPRRPPHCCARSPGLRLRLRLRLLQDPAPPLPSPTAGSPTLGLSQAAPLPAPGPSPALTCAPRSLPGATSGGAATPPLASGAPGRPGGLRAPVCSRRTKREGTQKSRSRGEEFLFFHLPLKCGCSAPF